MLNFLQVSIWKNLKWFVADIITAVNFPIRFDELLHFDWLSEWSKNRHPFRAFLFVESVVNRIGLWIGIGKLQKKSINYSLTLFGSVRKLSSSVSLIFPLSILAWYWLILFRLCWFICHGKFDYANSWLTDWKCWFSFWSDLLVPVFQKEDTAIQWIAQLISLLIKSAV